MESKRTERYGHLFFSVFKHVIVMDSGGKKTENENQVFTAVLTDTSNNSIRSSHQTPTS